ncbi:sigma-54 dependent transcriptional regulator [Thermithiobacillus plumbiphilus]|uniref:Sigma-54 dependent transcriptional regulator n=1 Tax=Thermithiobacillus plumbiphilus TaxID=1729899 RepID=A0ABU9DA66_9PROT
MRQQILIVEDERNLRRVLAAVLQAEGFDTLEAEDAQAGLSLIEQQHPALVLSDQRLPGMSGMEMLGEIKKRWPELPVVIATAYGEIQHAVEAIKAGAEHYLTKPVDEGELLAILRQILSRRGQPLPVLRSSQNYGIIGESPAIQELLGTIELVAPAPSNILITGESGTGKELVARAIHQASPRAEQPFVAVNCAAIPLELVESELFGFEKAAFTGATRSQIGKLEAAGQGTLFLDEIGDMPLAMQVKLLRALQERELTRLGSHQRIPFRARLVAATNVELMRAIEENRFREDLFYRLNVIPVHLPALRERRSDIPLLASHFVTQVCEAVGRAPMKVMPSAMEALAAYDWPGNIRELENMIERTVVLTRGGEIDLHNLPEHIRRRREATPQLEVAPSDLPGMERQAVVRALEQTQGNQSRAAQILGISRKQLRTKMKNFNLFTERERDDPLDDAD